MLKFKDIYDIKNNKEIKKLYEEAFPKEEKLPFNFLVKASRRNNIIFNIIYHEEKIIGLTYSLIYENNIYLLYFAVSNKYRSNGYGSKILDEYKNKYKDYNIILVIEEVDKRAKNFTQREKRKNFYLKNGFYELDLYLIEKEVNYQFLSTNPNTKVDANLLRNVFKQMISPTIRFLIRFYKINIETRM